MNSANGFEMEEIMGRKCKWKGRTAAFLLSIVLICTSLGTGINGVSAAAKVAINKKSLTLTVGSTTQLKISGTKKKVKWKSSKKSIATVSAKGKVKAKKAGKAVITAKVGKKTYKCKVTVKSKKSEAEQVVALVNQQRKAQGLDALSMDANMQKAAQARAKEIVQKFSHDRPNGTKCFTILKSYNVSYKAVAENIAAGQRTPKEVMNSWMHSPGHKANIMNKSYSRIGVALYKAPNSKYMYYWVQIFAD